MKQFEYGLQLRRITHTRDRCFCCSRSADEGFAARRFCVFTRRVMVNKQPSYHNIHAFPTHSIGHRTARTSSTKSHYDETHKGTPIHPPSVPSQSSPPNEANLIKIHAKRGLPLSKFTQFGGPLAPGRREGVLGLHIMIVFAARLRSAPIDC
ncbi:hypothetical protein EJ02DRAFT_456545 [Clathrospora elynae]|uniref:Uncharacterized protein n=1 Tax=Clathrospora elynae TaxID=706981 RepID=A0A6A5SRZ8_9PLEO|nr:hypothetical protein EJ02DRAFT_456545 [Clathrospora elynae]